MIQLFVQVEFQLRDLGFGYRAKFIQKSASQILDAGGLQWFTTLQDMKYKDAKQELMKLHGIGPKVNQKKIVVTVVEQVSGHDPSQSEIYK